MDEHHIVNHVLQYNTATQGAFTQMETGSADSHVVVRGWWRGGGYKFSASTQLVLDLIFVNGVDGSLPQHHNSIHYKERVYVCVSLCFIHKSMLSFYGHVYEKKRTKSYSKHINNICFSWDTDCIDHVQLLFYSYYVVCIHKCRILHRPNLYLITDVFDVRWINYDKTRVSIRPCQKMGNIILW